MALAIGLMLVLSMPLDEASAQQSESNEAVHPFKLRIPEQFRGRWAYDWSGCDQDTGLPVDGIFIGGVSFSTFARGKAEGTRVPAALEALGKHTMSLTLQDYSPPLLLRLEGSDHLTLEEGAKRHQFLRCKA